MAEKLGEALLDLDTNDKPFRKGVDDAERRATGLGRTLDDVSRRAVAMGKMLAVGAAAGVTAMGYLVKRSIDAADEMSKAALRAGTTTEELSRLAWAGELSDVSLGALTTSMARLNNIMAEVASGGAKDTKAIFEGIGVAVTEADGSLRASNEVFLDVAEVISQMENGAERSALAMQLFGRSGADLIPLLVNGRDGLRDMADEADRLGKTISTQTGRDAEQFNDTLTRIGAVVEGVGLKIATGILPDLQSLANKLNDPAFATGAAGMASTIVSALGSVVDAITEVLGWWGQLQRTVAFMSSHDIFGNPIEMSDQQKRLAEFRAMWKTRDQINAGEMTAPGADFYTGIFGGTSGSETGAGDTTDWSALFSDLGSSAGAAEDKVAALLSSLRAERDVLRETDPVQQRLISLREQLATATDIQRGEVESLIRTIHEETQAWENSQAAAQMFGDWAISSLEGLRKGTKSAIDVLNDLVDTLIMAVAQSMLLGQGPLAGIFGTASPGGGVGGLLGGLFSGFFAKGGLIPDGTFGIVGEAGPEPVIGTSRGAMVLPNSSLSGMMGSGGNTVAADITINGSNLSETELRQAITDALTDFSRHSLPGRVAEINADPMARG